MTQTGSAASCQMGGGHAVTDHLTAVGFHGNRTAKVKTELVVLGGEQEAQRRHFPISNQSDQFGRFLLQPPDQGGGAAPPPGSKAPTGRHHTGIKEGWGAWLPHVCPGNPSEARWRRPAGPGGWRHTAAGRLAEGSEEAAAGSSLDVGRSLEHFLHRL